MIIYSIHRYLLIKHKLSIQKMRKACFRIYFPNAKKMPPITTTAMIASTAIIGTPLLLEEVEKSGYKQGYNLNS